MISPHKHDVRVQRGNWLKYLSLVSSLERTSRRKNGTLSCALCRPALPKRMFKIAQYEHCRWITLVDNAAEILDHGGGESIQSNPGVTESFQF